MIRSALALALALMALLGALALKGQLLTLPEVPGSPATGFDANRAAARLQRILGDQRPHPVDSEAGDAVRARLIAEMRGVGLAPRITDDFACNNFARSRTIACARVRNLVATIGPAEGGHLLLVAHYDSSFAGPGAADDGIGVAALLEIAAQLRGQGLSRPVSFLINEGEEMGLIGARAFVERDPLAARVDTVVNLEARGVTGPAIMFETSRPNGAAIARYARTAERPVANSLTADLYRLVPNSTDVTVFAERDWSILNFAVIGNETRYHSAGDDLAALDRRSLRHMGEQALAIARDYAAGAPAGAAGERLYMDLLGRHLVVLPLPFGLVLLAILLPFFGLEAWRRRALGRPLLAMAAATAGSAALAWLGQFVLGLLRNGDYWRAYPLVTATAVYASALAACVATLLLVAGTAERTRLRAAFWLLFLAAGAAISAIAPGGAIFFLFPPLAAGVGMALSRVHRHAERVGAILAILLTYLTFGPALALLEELLSGGPFWLFAPLGATLLMPALIELRPLFARLRPALAVAGALDLAILGWIAAALTPAYSEDRQQLFVIEYVRNAAAREARFAVNNDGAPVPFEGEWRREEVPYSLRRRWVAPAPMVPVEAPAAELVAQQPVAGGRRLTLRIRSNGAQSVSLIAPAETELRAGGVSGFVRAFSEGGAEDKYYLRCIGRSCDGATLELVAGTGPVELTIVGVRSGLPPAAEPLARARPALARPQYSPDSTVAIGRMRLEAMVPRP